MSVKMVLVFNFVVGVAQHFAVFITVLFMVLRWVVLMVIQK